MNKIVLPLTLNICSRFHKAYWGALHISSCMYHEKSSNGQMHKRLSFLHISPTPNGDAKKFAMHVLVWSSPLPEDIGWMDDLRFYVILNSISVISGR